MFKTLCVILFALPLALALTLNPPTTQVYSSSPVTITWSTSSGDSTFDLYVTNPSFRNTFALANNVQASQLTINLTLPAVPAGDGYTFQASAVGNINSVLSQTSTFTIDAALSSTSTPSSTGGSSGSNPSSTPAGVSSTPNSSSSSSSSSSSTVVPTGSFNGNNNGALGMTRIGATVMGILVGAGAYFAF